LQHGAALDGERDHGYRAAMPDGNTTVSERGKACRIGVIGLGKIATDRHLPTIAADPAFELAGVADLRGDIAACGVPAFRCHGELLSAVADLDAVAICTPPTARHRIALDALAAGKHVLLEKPPAATISGLMALQASARQAGRVLFTAWHSQHNTAVEEARRLLAGTTVLRIAVEWQEDVRKWHPGQAWIWQPGGYGVFDAGSNALSILTRILPEAPIVRDATLLFPANAGTPIAARIGFSLGGRDDAGGAAFDWRGNTAERREITITTRAGACLVLSASGGRLAVDGAIVVDETRTEYPRLYRRFGELIGAGASEVDAGPLILVADAFQLGRRVVVEPFHDGP
jgi:D-galactose 1-dehydrogenase